VKNACKVLVGNPKKTKLSGRFWQLGGSKVCSSGDIAERCKLNSRNLEKAL
jgi:hypothetical protein